MTWEPKNILKLVVWSRAEVSHYCRYQWHLGYIFHASLCLEFLAFYMCMKIQNFSLEFVTIVRIENESSLIEFCLAQVPLICKWASCSSQAEPVLCTKQDSITSQLSLYIRAKFCSVKLDSFTKRVQNSRLNLTRLLNEPSFNLLVSCLVPLQP